MGILSVIYLFILIWMAVRNAQAKLTFEAWLPWILFLLIGVAVFFPIIRSSY